MKKCPFCLEEIHEEAILCKHCKADLSPKANITNTSYPAAGFICSNCGSVGDPKSITKGSILIEIILWLCFLIPGIIYSIWRLTTRYKACRSCGSANMIPINSPVGKKLQNGFR